MHFFLGSTEDEEGIDQDSDSEDDSSSKNNIKY